MKSNTSFVNKLSRRIVECGILSFVISMAVSFVILVPILRKRAVKIAENDNAAILKRMESTLSFVENYTQNMALSIAQNSDVQSYLNDPTEMKRNIASVALNNLTSYEGMIRGICLIVKDTPNLDSLSKMTDQDLELLESDWIMEMETEKFSRQYSSVYQAKLGRQTYYTMAYARNFYQNNRWCTLVVFFSLNTTLYDIDILGSSNFDFFLLRDSYGNVFYRSGNGNWKNIDSELSGNLMNGKKEIEKGILFIKTSVGNNCSVVSGIMNNTILVMLIPYSVGLFLAMVFFLLITLFMTSRSVGKMIDPVIELSHNMHNAASGNLNCKVQSKRDDEIGLLETSFNKMLDNLKESFEMITEQEKKEQQARFSLLVSQIDPHFIYNTMNSINYLARRRRCDDIVVVNTALLTILRDRLRVNDIQITDSVANEMRVLDQYIMIERFMYDGDFTFRWDVDENLLNEQIPKNMIQPLVENSLFHGLIDEENGEISGTITVRIQRNEQGIVVQVEDDGLGIDEAQLEQLREEKVTSEERGNRIGLANVRGRLYYLYHDDQCLQIESSPKHGTCVTMVFMNKVEKQK